MFNPNSILRLRLASTLAGILSFAAWSAAESPSTHGLGKNPPVDFAVKLLPGEILGQERIFRTLIKSGTNEFIFVVPEGLRVEVRDAGSILMASQDLGYYVSIRMLKRPPSDGRLTEALREQIARQYPQARNLEEYNSVVADRAGTGFQLRQALPGGNPRLVHILWVPFRAGLFEFVLSTDSSNASAGFGAFDMIRLTFSSNEGGKLTIVPRSDKT